LGKLRCGLTCLSDKERNVVVIVFILIIASLFLDAIVVSNGIVFANISFGFFTEVMIVFMLIYLGFIEKSWAIKLASFSAAAITVLLLSVELTQQGFWVVYR
jgi:hypothetical protein